MNLLRIGILIVALVVAGVVALLVNNFLASQEQTTEAAAPAMPTTRVLVAAKNLPAGKTLLGGELEGDVKWQSWPEDSVNPGWIVSREGEEDSGGRQEIAGAIVKRGFEAGEPITLSRLIKKGSGNFMAGVLGPGMRAVSIAISAVSAAAGFIVPGSKVDVMLTQRLSETDSVTGTKRARVVTEIILADALVLAIDQTVDDLTGGAVVGRTATIETTPKEAEQVEVARSMGTLSLSLRSLRPAEKVVSTGPFTSEIEVSRFLSRDAGSVNPILTARGRLSAGSLLTDANFEWQAPPPEFPLDGLLVKGRFNISGLRGALLTASYEPGQPLREKDIIKPSSQEFLASALGQDMRAISVAVSNVSGVSGFISPGSRVDLLLTHELQDNDDNPPLTPRRFSETILRDVRVLAIEQQVDESTGKPTLGATATLEVTPKQAEMVFVAVSMGALSLTLKGARGDSKPPSGRPFTSDLEVSRAAWEFIRGLNRYGPGQAPKPQSNEGITSEDVAEKPEPLLAPPPPALEPVPVPAAAPPPPQRVVKSRKSRSVVKVYRNVGVSTVPVNR